MNDRTWAFLEAIKNMALSIMPLYVAFENDKFRLDLVVEMRQMEQTLKKLHASIKKSGTWGASEREQYITIDKRMDEILYIGERG